MPDGKLTLAVIPADDALKLKASTIHRQEMII
jgi:hypothetical protein